MSIIAVGVMLDAMIAAVAGVIGVIALVAALRNPDIGLLAYAATIPIQEVFTSTGPVNNIAKFWGIVFLGSYLFHVRGRLDPRVFSKWLWGWVGWTVVTSLWAAANGPIAAWTLLQLFALALVIAGAVSHAGPELALKALWAFSLGASIAALFAVSGFVSLGPSELVSRTAGFDDQSVAHFASYMIIPILLGAFTLSGAAASSRLMRPLALVFTPLAVVALLLTGTRSAWLAAVVGVAILLLKARLRLVLLGAIIAFTVVASVNLLPGASDLVEDRVGTAVVSGGAGRTSIWAVGVGILAENPVAGVGYGSFGSAFDSDAIATAPFLDSVSPTLRVNRGSHSIYLGIAVETGLIGLALWIMAIATLLLPKVKPYRQPFYAIFVAYLVQGFFLDILNRKYFWLALALLAGVTAWDIRQVPINQAEPPLRVGTADRPLESFRFSASNGPTDRPVENPP